MAKMINGIASYLETHFEIVSVITNQMRKEPIPSKVIADRYATQGTGGMYELAEELTDKFEDLYKGTVWNGDFFDTIEEFINKEFGI